MKTLWLAGLATTGAVLAALVWRGVVVRSSQLFCRSVFEGRGRRHSIALTFDDGPGLQTVELARYLHEQNVCATFFLCGVNAERHPAIVQALAAAGHELGNHTHTHRRLCPRLGWILNLLSPSAVFSEFAKAQTAISQAGGIAPRLMRAPYGLRWYGMRRVQQAFGLTDVMWTVIAHDWEWNAEKVSSHVLRHARAGAILCMHDGRDTRVNPDITVTLEGVRHIVTELKRRGYRFETVSELLRPDPR